MSGHAQSQLTAIQDPGLSPDSTQVRHELEVSFDCPPTRSATPSKCGLSHEAWRAAARSASVFTCCVLLLAAGCKPGGNDQQGEISQVRRTLVNPRATKEQLWIDYERLLTLPPEENMNSWVRIVNDHSLQPEQRLLAFHAFWGRAVAPGTTLQQLARRYAIDDWFSPQTVQDQSGASQLPPPVERYRRHGWNRHSFVRFYLPGRRPSLDAAPVYGVLSRPMGPEEIVDCVRRPESTEDVQILAVWVYGRDDQDTNGSAAKE